MDTKEIEMAALDLEMFTSSSADLESAQYRILAATKQAEQEFRHNMLYPRLGDFIELVSVLETIQANREQYRSVLPRRLTGVDFEKKTLLFDAMPADEVAVERLFELIAWALPSLKALTEEGVAMFDFVAHNLSIDIVGIMPLYRDEGYAFIPDPKAGLSHVIRYEMSLYHDDNDKYRAMKTFEIQTRDMRIVHDAPESVKLELIKEHKDMPNPATYIVDTDLDFPFEETILPVAKRKLMRVLIS